MAELKVPLPKEYPTGPRPPADVSVSLGQTLGAQYSNIFSPISEGLSFYGDNQATYDPDSIQNVEDLIKEFGFEGTDASYLRTYGIGSQENLQAALSYIDKRGENREVLAQSSGAALFVTDPSLLASVAIPYFGIAITGRSASLVNSLSSSSALNQALKAREVLRGGASIDDVIYRASQGAKTSLDGPRVAKSKVKYDTNAEEFIRLSDGSALRVGKKGSFDDGIYNAQTVYNAKTLAKLGALDAAVVDGSVSLTEAMTQISEGKDPIEEIANAALYTSASTAIGSMLGYGIGSALPRPKNAATRTATFNNAYKEYLKSVSSTPPQTDEGLSLAGKWFNDSWFMRAIPSILRTTLRDKELPDFAKLDILGVMGDNGMPLAMNQMNRSVGSSVAVKAARRQGDWFKALDVINTNYREVSPRGNAQFLNVPVGEYVEKVRRKIGASSFAPDEWYNHIGRLMVDEVPFEKMTPQEAASVQAARSFFDKYGKELEELGLINARDVFDTTFDKATGNLSRLESLTENIIEQNRRWMTPQLRESIRKIEELNGKLSSLNKTATTRGLTNKQLKFQKDLEREVAGHTQVKDKFEAYFAEIDSAKNVDDLAGLYNKLDLTPDMQFALKDLAGALTEARAKVANAKEMLDRAPATASQNSYLTRIYNRRKITKERDAFRKILVDWFRENPEQIVKGDDGLFKVQKLNTDEDSLIARADRTIENILGETDEDAIDAIFTGIGRSGPLISKRLNIPNKLIKDFIVTDIKEVMIAYTSRVAPKIEYHSKFRNPETGKLMSLESRISYYRERLAAEGVSERKIDEYIKNFVASYDLVVGSTLKRTDAIDTKFADALRTTTSWTFLGSSGVAAMGDAASIFMDHELNVIGRSFLGMMDDISLKMSTRELQLAGEALEIVRGTTHLKYLESLTNDAFSKTLPDKLNNAFYIMNGLAPVTVAIKSLDGLLRGHTIIEASNRLIDGTASKFEKEFLARYNITKDLAKRISDSPYQKSNGELFLPNTEAWTDEIAVNAFRDALSSGVINRVIMGTPADKPLAMNGVAYVPDSVAQYLPFDLPVDPRVQGYRRVESGLLALPFTFYSYTMGALSKITGNYASGSVRNKAAHTAVALGLGYAIVRSRTPSWAWDDMDTEDKIMRSFDFSGLAAIYSDMTYRAIAMANEMGVESSFPIQPKYDAGVDRLGAVVSLGGAPADWSYEVLSSIKQMLDGDVQDGAKGLIKMTPLIDSLAIGDGIKDTAKDLASGLPNRP